MGVLVKDDKPSLGPDFRPRSSSTEQRSTLHLPLDERQRMLIYLLLAGHTDATAASRLGVSSRTVTNILRSLMDRLGVDNRFQLGVALGTRMHQADYPDPRVRAARGSVLRGATARSGRPLFPTPGSPARPRDSTDAG
ncbi:helix-turn-helix transcriptional regulator (plasmid) [Streptomyces sp. AHU1]|uniref:helix-turn-helix domain-containing protein n=1 Tax=Streptomyces sp. AHU1 TaxID=3377215 RepID=UPI0038779FDA